MDARRRPDQTRSDRAFVPAQSVPRPPGWAPGSEPAWARSPVRTIALDAVRDTLTGRVGRPAPLAAPNARESAVLVALSETAGGLSFVMTRRSWDLRHHRGEVSFPGGGREADDADLVQTALREAHEEANISPDDVEVVGELDHLTTVSSDRFIVPVVGIVGSLDALSPQESEVDEILTVPVPALLVPGVHREEIWRRELDGKVLEHPINFFDVPPDVIWGATAAMVRQLFDLLLG